MFRHVALWKFSEDCDNGVRRRNAIKIKAGLEELEYEVHGVRRIRVHIDPARGEHCGGSDMFMEGVFESREAYEAFVEHPRRKAVYEILEDCVEEVMDMNFPEEPKDVIPPM